MDEIVSRGLKEEDRPWELPEGWAWTTVAKVAQLRGEKVDPQSEPDLPFVGLDDIAPNGLEIARSRRFGTMKSSGNRFRADDVLYCRLRPYLNKTAVPKSEGACSGELLALVPQAAEPRFLQYFLHSRHFVNAAMAVVSGDRPRIDFGEFGAFAFPLPPLAEQKRIVARIDALFAEIAEGEAALREARKDLETFRRALLKAAVTGELTKDWRAANRPKEMGHELLERIRAGRAEIAVPKARGKRATVSAGIMAELLPELPDGWAWCMVRQIASVIGGLTKNQDREKMAKSAPYLRVANVQAGHLDLEEIKQIGVTTDDLGRASLKAGDLLVVEGNGSIDQIGRCALWNDEIVGCVHQNHIIKVRFDEPALSRWVLQWLLSPHGRSQIESVAASTSGLHTLSISKIEALPVPIPPLSEVDAIAGLVAETMSAAMDTLTALDAEAADAARLRQSVLKAAFEGRLAPQDPTDEAASALLARLKIDGESLSRSPRRRTYRKI